MLLVFFWCLAAFTIATAWLIGGSPERWTATILLIAALLTVAVRSPFPVRYAHVEIGVATVDVLLMVPLVVIALSANRWWPIYVAGLQLFTLIGHLGKAVNHNLWRGAYNVLITFPSYAILLLLLAGAIRHRRRVHRNGAERSWRRSSRRSVVSQAEKLPTY